MNWEIEKLYDIYNDVKDKSKSSFIPKVRKDDVVTIKYEYNNKLYEFTAKALYDSIPNINRYNKEETQFIQNWESPGSSIWIAEWDGENWVADLDHQFH